MPLSRRIRFGLTARTALVAIALALLVVGAMVMTHLAFVRQSQALQRLGSVEVEQLMGAARLLQQAELLASGGRTLASAQTQPQRRQASVELGDRLEWTGKLMREFAQARGDTALADDMRLRTRLLEDNVRALDAAVREQIDAPQDEAATAAARKLTLHNQELAGSLAALIGWFAADTRSQLAEQSAQLAREVDRQRRNLLALTVLLLLAVIGAALYFERHVVRRILRLKRMVDDGELHPGELRLGAADELSNLADTVGAYVMRARAQEAQMVRANADLAFLAEHDALTKLPNRRHFSAAATHLLAQASAPLFVIIGDIDHFKQVNDTHGHAVGDDALVHIAQLLKEGLRDGEVLARYGGEEFVAIVPAASAAAACKAVERLRAMVAERPLALALATTPLAALPPLQLTMSFGVAAVSMPLAPATPAAARDALEATLRAADQALYAAKRGGRNRVELAALPPRAPTAATPPRLAPESPEPRGHDALA